ncbi:MAG TPA: 4-alpha-glucanotransferase [Acidimicrobiales bacterium]|nr:4-alpha-glucanotransferase [Acidimicrobiales bacterium]
MHIDPQAWGIDAGYWNAAGHWQETAEASIAAVAEAMGAAPDQPVPPEETAPLWFVAPGRPEQLHNRCELLLEDGTDLGPLDILPSDLPLGYHQLRPVDGGPSTRLVVSPKRCHLPDDLRTWGWAVQLYAARSRASWGIGDLGDLARLCRWSRGQGAGLVVINPLHAPGPALPQAASPYYPSSRRYRNPLYLRIEDVPGASRLGPELERMAAAGRALNDDRRIERDRVWELKADALSRCFALFTGDPCFDDFVTREGVSLTAFATYCAIAEVHGNGWRTWPTELQRPDSGAVSAFATERADRVRFHAWLQWLFDRQLAAAATLPLVEDLAVGFDPGGADAWAWQELLALDMRVGAPPDEFNGQGQDWGLPPFVPWKLRACGYQPFIDTIRASLRHAGGLRVDHVMGLFRLFWIPLEGGPSDGTYVRYPAAELLDILALESHRAGAFVVGEDLGTVENSVREELAERAVLSYRLLWFEDGPPEQFPHQALAAVTTHDLPTIAGMWTGADLADQQRIGLAPNESGQEQLRSRLAKVAGVGDGAAVDEITSGAYSALARAPSRVVVATLDDALGVRERPNMPGTTDQWPNWSLALPAPLEEVEVDPQVAAVAEVLAEGR